MRLPLTTGKLLRMFKTVGEIIDAKGGNAAVASATGYDPGAVALWRHRNKLPRRAWPEIMTAWPDVKLGHLLALEAANDAKPQRKVAA